MTRARPHGRNLMAAFLAVIGLLLQGAIGMSPASANPGQTIEICTAHGAKTITLDQAGKPVPSKSGPCPHCDQCLSPALAVATTAGPILAQPVRYAVRADVGRPVLIFATSARGPPRPPSQAPPAFLNV